jgi:hypothetical protein
MQMVKRTEARTDVTKLIVAFGKFANAPIKEVFYINIPLMQITQRVTGAY